MTLSVEIKPAGSPLPAIPASKSPFDFVVVAGDLAEATLVTLRPELPGKTPVIFGSPSRAADLFEATGMSRDSPGDILERAATLELDSWFASREADLRRYASSAKHDWPPHGAWPDQPRPLTTLSLLTDRDGSPSELMVIGLLPCEESSTVPAHVRFGRWNNCPEPAVHVALARRWSDSNGAELVAIARDAIEFRVARPIATRADAMQMAMAHYLYCYETVDVRPPEYATMEFTAAMLIGATIWQFWWD
jgi:hypothetical protein